MHRALVALLPLLLFVGTAGAHPLGGSFSVGSPAYVNFMLDHFEWPDLAPGESGAIRFFLNNTYPYTMQSVVLRLEIYRYVDLYTSLTIDANWTHARPSFYEIGTGREIGRHFEKNVANLTPRQEVEVSIGVVTDTEAPHGSLTKQGAYIVRTYMEFDLTDGTTTNRSVMLSKGFFTNSEFATARMADGASCPVGHYCEGILDLSVLGNASAVQERFPGRDHIDGLLAEGDFSVADRMPLWPFVAVSGVMVASFVFAILFYAEENPGKFPRLAMWWMAVRGKVRGLRPSRPE